MVKKLVGASSLLNWLAAVAMVITLFVVFFFAPEERTMGNVQRIFYFHVGGAWVAAVTFLVALLAGVSYLRNPSSTKDVIALASVEIGIVFTTTTIVSGSVWGRPAWNTWWEWTPRLTSITVLWLVYMAYFMLRGAVEDEERKKRYAAVYVIAAFVTVIMTYISIRLLRDLHPVVFGGAVESAQGGQQGLQEIEPGLASAKMGMTLTSSVITFSLIYVAWLVNRIKVQNIVDEVGQLKMRVMARLEE
ncbi:MAG: cytochrome c biogenesis protein [Candidatus Promineifilaceae bacterium]|jgi:heme exporter protein C